MIQGICFNKLRFEFRTYFSYGFFFNRYAYIKFCLVQLRLNFTICILDKKNNNRSLTDINTFLNISSTQSTSIKFYYILQSNNQ